ncbi:MAG: N-acetyl-gamma-glutamyl-phosphate reductase [Gemmatimonadetes bacterium]|nr:N-acetyl-gamma-glutamyl-phosphate reductase [Gemmatimonadota bacterium]
MHKIPVGVLGASGYAGRELCALILGHPRLSLAFASANAQRGEHFHAAGSSITFAAPEDVALASAELVFSALPHGASADWVARTREAGARAVDLSADLRIGNGASDVPYGLTEVARAEVTGAQVIANPGCYPTATLIAILPLLEAGLVVAGSTISISAASGVTGAGMAPRTDLLFGEVTENFKAYGVANEHRHLREMRAMVARTGADVDLLFTPHLLPVARGILATILVPLSAPLADPLAPLRARWKGERFIEVSAEPPALRDVVHRNVVRLSARMAAHVRTPTLQVFAAIDNLVKGAAGQALQNANLALGLAEDAGLPA